MSGHPFGIDFGGTGIKGAPVDLELGDFAAERVRVTTPQPATPTAVAAVLAEPARPLPRLDRPGRRHGARVVRHGVVGSAANIDPSWVGTDADALFSEATGRESTS